MVAPDSGRNVLGYSPIEAGAAYLPLTFAVGVFAGIGAKLATKIGSRPVIAAGALIAAAVFGGMVPRDTNELLREQISDRNPAMTFIQGLAGIAGLIAAQVQASITGEAEAQTGLAVTYDPQTRTVGLRLDRPEDVQVAAWWHTSFTPPEPAALPWCSSMRGFRPASMR